MPAAELLDFVDEDNDGLVVHEPPRLQRLQLRGDTCDERLAFAGERAAEGPDRTFEGRVVSDAGVARRRAQGPYQVGLLVCADRAQVDGERDNGRILVQPLQGRKGDRTLADASLIRVEALAISGGDVPDRTYPAVVKFVVGGGGVTAAPGAPGCPEAPQASSAGVRR